MILQQAPRKLLLAAMLSVAASLPVAAETNQDKIVRLFLEVCLASYPAMQNISDKVEAVALQEFGGNGIQLNSGLAKAGRGRSGAMYFVPSSQSNNGKNICSANLARTNQQETVNTWLAKISSQAPSSLRLERRQPTEPRAIIEWRVKGKRQMTVFIATGKRKSVSMEAHWP